MSLTRSIAHNSAIQLAGKIISTLLGILAVAIMTRALGLEQFGWYVTAAGFLQFVGIISDFGFAVTTSNLLSEPAFDKTKLLNTIFTWRFITAVFFQGLAPLLILLFPYPNAVKVAVAITTISFFAQALSQVFVGYYRVKLKMWVVMASEILGRIILVAGVAGVAFWHLGFLPVMTIITIAAVISTIYLWIKIGKINFSLDREISIALYKKMWPTALAVIFNSFYLQGDRVILPLYAPQTAVALYGASYRVLDVVTQLASMLMGTIMPVVTFAYARGEWDKFKHRLQLGFDLLCLLLIPMVTGLWVLATPVMRLIAGKDFVSAGPILKLLSLAVAGICFGMIFGHYALAINRQKQALWVYISDAVLSVVGYFIFIPRFGINGAIGVTIFSEWYAGILLAIITAYYTKTFPKIITFIKILLASLIMGWLVNYIQPFNVIFSIFFGATIYILLIITFRVISLVTIREITSLKPQVASSNEI